MDDKLGHLHASKVQKIEPRGAVAAAMPGEPWLRIELYGGDWIHCYGVIWLDTDTLVYFKEQPPDAARP